MTRQGDSNGIIFSIPHEALLSIFRHLWLSSIV